LKRVLALNQKVGNLKPMQFSDDEGSGGENTAADDDANDRESRAKDSRSRLGSRGQKRSRSSSEEIAEESEASSSSATSNEWRSDASEERLANEAKQNRGAGFEGSEDGSPTPRGRRGFRKVSSSSSDHDEDSGKDVDEGARDDNDESESEAERQRMMTELFGDDSDDVAEAEDEVEASKASRGGDGQPSLGQHPNVSDREFV
jgi:hypothetical protein